MDSFLVLEENSIIVSDEVSGSGFINFKNFIHFSKNDFKATSKNIFERDKCKISISTNESIKSKLIGMLPQKIMEL